MKIEKKNNIVDSETLSSLEFHTKLSKEQFLKLKNKSQTLSELGVIAKIERIKLKKEKPKQKLQMLLSIYSVILALHNDEYSLRDIKQHLQSKYKKTISHTYLSKYINEYIIKKDVNHV